MTTRSSQDSQELAAELDRAGHVIRTCSDSTDPRATPCAALRNEMCPLDSYPIDAAVDVGVIHDHGLATGGLCAARRRIPLVLVDRSGDALEPWATASVPRARVAATVAALGAAELTTHTAIARRTLDEEMGRVRPTGAGTGVEVRRRSGGLVVDLSPDSALTQGEIEKLAVHVVQRLRAFDPWAKTIDVHVD
jgi:hypothetical protein